MLEPERPKQEHKPTEPKATPKPMLRWVVGSSTAVVVLAGIAVGIPKVGQWMTALPAGSIQLREPDCTLFTVPGDPFAARVTGVPDSDDVQVQTQDIWGVKHGVRVRLADIDSPEVGQPHHDQVKAFITEVALDREVTIRWRQNNDFRPIGGICRIVGSVYLPDGQDLSYKLLLKGYAWHYLEYSRHPEYEQVQNEAKGNLDFPTDGERSEKSVSSS